MKKIAIIFISLLLFPCYVWADVSVALKIEQLEADLMDSIRIVVSVSGIRGGNEPKIYNLDDFIVRQGGTSRRMEFVNGSFSSSVDYTYFIQPKSIGTFKIGPAEVEVKGKIYRSDVKKLIVRSSVDKDGRSKPVFLTAELSSNKAYIEEQLVYSLKLYHIHKVSNVSLVLPDIQNISFKQIGEPLKHNAVYNSRSYKVLEVKYSLIATKAGKYEIEPAKMNMTVYKAKKGSGRHGGIFDDFFPDDSFFSLSEGRTITVACEPSMLNVFQIPDKGKPSDFSGLVGRFSIASVLEPSSIKAGESTTLTVTLKGWGNVNRIPDLKIPEIMDAKIYADQPILKTNIGERGIEGIKTMKWAIVPEREGKYNIPLLSISYFDTKKKAYKKLKTSSQMLIVLQGSAKQSKDEISSSEDDHITKNRKEMVEELGRDIFPIHSSIKDLSSGSQFTALGWLSWLLLFSPFLVYIAFASGLKVTDKTSERMAQSRASKATASFIKQYKEKDVCADSLSYALRNYMNDRFNMEAGSLGPHEVSSILKTKGCSEKTAKQMESLLLNLENVIYTGQGDKTYKSGEDITKIIRTIEKEIR